jgi:hypothetical protein
MSLRTITLIATLALSALSGCGDDGDSAKPAANGSAAAGAAADGKVGSSDPEAVIDTLNSAEWKAACVDIASAGNNRELAEGPCVLAGIVSSALGISCMDTYELCTESEPDVDCEQKPASCTATLREADACNVALLRHLAEETKDLSCASSLNALTGIDQTYVPEECKVVMAKCPEFQSSGSPSGGSDFSDF